MSAFSAASAADTIHCQLPPFSSNNAPNYSLHLVLMAWRRQIRGKSSTWPDESQGRERGGGEAVVPLNDGGGGEEEFKGKTGKDQYHWGLLPFSQRELYFAGTLPIWKAHFHSWFASTISKFLLHFIFNFISANESWPRLWDLHNLQHISRQAEAVLGIHKQTSYKF